MKTVVGICDDFPAAIHELERHIWECAKESGSDIEIVTFLTGKELLENAEKLDILFLDIEMPEMDGIEVGKKIRDTNPRCIIVMATSIVERFKDAFKIGAFRFVTKPFDSGEIKEALMDARKTMIGQEDIELYYKRKPHLIEQRDILVVESYGSYVEMLVFEQHMRKNIPMAEVEKLLNPQLFYKIDKKHMVNLLHIKKYEQDEIFIGEEIYKVSRRRKKEFEQKYFDFIVSYGAHQE